MHPAKFPDEHQGGIHGTNSPISASISEVRVVLVSMNKKENNIKDE
jgi:hypothetical protein